MKFEWDSDKARENLRKHGVEMGAGIPVFDDPLAITRFDAEHSGDEQRFNIIGFGERILLFVTYAVRADEVIRLINVRPADGREKGWYYEK
ncbi:MAG: BrnT family toxin [Acidobacteria bacterium]|nr:BrnT family toxin [Acidobacteriota bacterium]